MTSDLLAARTCPGVIITGLLLISFLWLSGCGAGSFTNAGVPPVPSAFVLASPPWSEYWAGITSNNSMAGYSHLTIAPVKDEPGLSEIRSDASPNFLLLVTGKSIAMSSRDVVLPDFSLVRSSCDLYVNGSIVLLEGLVRDGLLELRVTSGGQTFTERLSFREKLYPMSAINFLPVKNGLGIGARYAYQVFDPQSRTIEDVIQEVVGFQESPLFKGKGFKLSTTLQDQGVISWLSPEGLPLREVSTDGTVVSSLQAGDVTKRFLADAVLNKNETMLGFALIRVAAPISAPGKAKSMEVVLSGIDETVEIPSDSTQWCEREGEKVLCRVGASGFEESDSDVQPGEMEQRKYLLPTAAAPSADKTIRAAAAKASGQADTPEARIRAVLQWIRSNIASRSSDAVTALDVLSTGEGGCQGQSYVMVAFARALGIPSRVVNGLVYSQEAPGFLYHSWCEVFLKGVWVPADPVLGELPANATHIKLVEGESIEDITPMLRLIGRIRIEVSAMNQ